MSFWNEITKPVNDVLDSKVFKAVMPVQALGQEAVKLGSGLAGVNGGRGLNPADQYAIGAGTGAALAGGSAIAGSGTSAGMVPYTPTSTPNMASAGSTLGAGGSSSPLSLGGYGQSSAASTPAASSWEAHAAQARNASPSNYQTPNIYDQQKQKKQNPMPPPAMPVMKHTGRLPV